MTPHTEGRSVFWPPMALLNVVSVGASFMEIRPIQDISIAALK